MEGTVAHREPARHRWPVPGHQRGVCGHDRGVVVSDRVRACRGQASVYLIGGAAATVWTFFLLALLLGNVLLASLAMGQSAAALREAEEPRELALAGLVLGGLYVAAVLGVGTLALWQS